MHLIYHGCLAGAPAVPIHLNGTRLVLSRLALSLLLMVATLLYHWCS